MTHAALLSGKYDIIHYNDIGDAPKLFEDAINGKYRNECRWISREQFFAEKRQRPLRAFPLELWQRWENVYVWA